MVDELDACLFNDSDFLVQYLLGKSVLRNTVAEHTTHLIHHVVNGDAVSHDGQIIGSG